MTNQEIFDKVATHLLTQKAKSLVGLGFSCMYRGPNGLKCAVGCLISDEVYDEKLEYNVATSAVVLDALAASGVNINGAGKYLLRDLQVVHDIHAVDEWADKLLTVAQDYNLDPSVVSNFK